MVNSETGSQEHKKIFVTGGTGLVGSHLLRELALQSHDVVALYRGVIPPQQFSDKVNWIKGDILDVILLDEAMVNIDEVYHCAAKISFNPRHKELMLHVNVKGTANVVNAALNANVDKLCYVSSVAALGEQGNASLIKETATYTEQKYSSTYSLSKHLAETEVWRAIGEGLKCVIVNPTIILGTSDWTSGSTQIFKTAYEAFPWYADGVNGFVDVNDVVRAMMTLMNSQVSGERFIVSGDNKTYRDVFTAIANSFGKRPPYKKGTSFLAALVWRMEALKGMFTGSEPLITKETATDALMKMEYDNRKFKTLVPSFVYTPFQETIDRVCIELRKRYSLL